MSILSRIYNFIGILIFVCSFMILSSLGALAHQTPTQCYQAKRAAIESERYKMTNRIKMERAYIKQCINDPENAPKTPRDRQRSIVDWERLEKNLNIHERSENAKFDRQLQEALKYCNQKSKPKLTDQDWKKSAIYSQFLNEKKKVHQCLTSKGSKSNYVKYREWYTRTMQDIAGKETTARVQFLSGVGNLKVPSYKCPDFPRQVSVWKSGHMEQQSHKGHRYTGEIVQFSGSQDKCTATWKAFDHKRNKVDGNWPVTISFSNGTITILEHHSSQKWVGTCGGSKDSLNITCNGKEMTKGNFIFTIKLNR